MPLDSNVYIRDVRLLGALTGRKREDSVSGFGTEWANRAT